MPGPNDYHIKSGSDGLHPGLGADEPSDDLKAEVKLRSTQRLEALKEEIKAQTAELSEKEREIERREHELSLREAKLKAAESAAPPGSKR